MDEILVTAQDVEQLIADNGMPEELILSARDFSLVFSIYRQVTKDETGPFIQVLHTNIRPKTAAEKTVDLSDGEPLSTLKTVRTEAAVEAAKTEVEAAKLEVSKK